LGMGGQKGGDGVKEGGKNDAFLCIFFPFVRCIQSLEGRPPAATSLESATAHKDYLVEQNTYSNRTANISWIFYAKCL